MENKKFISLATSKITDKVRSNVNACLEENRLGTGRFVKEFEEKIKRYMNVEHAVAVCNGSMADTIALAALKIKYPQKTEVIVPALTFIAQTNSILINGLKPVFVDVREHDYQMDFYRIEEHINENTLAIFPVHLLGMYCDIQEIVELANKHSIAVVEDCCEAFGGNFAGKKLGTFGDFGTFSFFPSHTITTGEGGMIITNNDELAELARQTRNHGRKSDNILEKFHFDTLGFNGKMSNLNAAIGSAVVGGADKIIQKRQRNVDFYNSAFDKNWLAVSPHCYPMMSENRDKTIERLWNNGIETRKLFSSLPTQEKVYAYMGYKLGSFPVAEKIGREGYFLPIHQDLTKKDLDYIVSKI